MKRYLITLLLHSPRIAVGVALMLVAGLLSPCQAEHYRVYLLGGQSNATGRGDASQLTNSLSHLALAQTNVLFYHRQDLEASNLVLAEDTWIDLAPGSGCGYVAPSHDLEFGPEVAFGYDLAAADPTRHIAIIKYGYGGSSLSGPWSATGARYTAFVATVYDALDALTANGDTYELCGMLWQQGENDASGAADSYETNLTDLISRVRAEFFGGLNRPFVVGGLSNSQYSEDGEDVYSLETGEGTVRAAQEAVATNISQVGFANSDDLPVWSAYHLHFDGVGQAALGAAHAAQMILLEANDADDDGLTLDEEIALGTSPDFLDSDGDGQNDGVEVLTGTDPTSDTSYFAITGFAISNGATHLEWPSKPGNSYVIEKSINLVDWTVVDASYPAASVGTKTVWAESETVAVTGTVVLAQYDAQTGISGNFNTTAFDSVDTDSQTTASRLAQGGSLSGSVISHAIFDTSASGSAGFNFTGATTLSQTDAALAGDFFYFTVSPNGATVDYSSLSFYSDQWTTGGQVDVSYTIDSVETFVLQGYVLAENNGSVTLNTIDFANFSSDEEVQWTFYLYGQAYGNRFDDITLVGSVSASESITALFDAQTGISGNFTTTAFDSVDNDGQTTASRLTQGGSLSGSVISNAIFNTSDSGSSAFNFTGATSLSQTDAALAGDFFYFTVSPEGATVDYHSLSFYSDQWSTGGAVDVSYTLDSVETFILQGYVPVEGNASVTLETIDFTDFSSEEEVQWTFYLYGQANGTRFDDIKLLGQSIGAEPGDTAFFRISLQLTP